MLGCAWEVGSHQPHVIFRSFLISRRPSLWACRALVGCPVARWVKKEGRKEGWEERGEKRKKRKGMKGRLREIRERDEERQTTAQSRLCGILPGTGVGGWGGGCQSLHLPSRPPGIPGG